MLFWVSSLGLGALRDTARIRRAHFYPRLQVGDLFRGKLFVLWRHLEVFICVADRLDQKALFRVAGRDGRAGVAAFEQTIARVEQEAAFDFFRLRAVALVAVLDKD